MGPYRPPRGGLATTIRGGGRRRLGAHHLRTVINITVTIDSNADRVKNTPPLISVVVPTYNEAENVGPLIERLDAAFKSAGLPYEVVVVDDNSP
ncbi:MAG: glycosyltransferase, partial [Thermoproteus sp.]